MTIEKADKPSKVHVTLWSPSHEVSKVERVPVPLSDEVRFEFYRPATTEQGGVYAEA